MDALGEIQTMIQTSGFSRAKLAAILREMMPVEKVHKAKRELASPVTMYTQVQKTTTCLHCGSTQSTVLSLTKGEDTVGITKEGKVMIINSSSPAQVNCAASHCSWCADFVKRLSREELEERYLLLLNKSSIFNNPFGNLISREGREVKL